MFLVITALGIFFVLITHNDAINYYQANLKLLTKDEATRMSPFMFSFFTKGHTQASKGIKDAVIYGLSVILVNVGLGMLI